MIEEINDLKWIPYFLVFLLVINPSLADSNFSNIQRMVRKIFKAWLFSVLIRLLINRSSSIRRVLILDVEDHQ